MFLFDINTLLLPIKIHYFLWYGGTAPVASFLSIYTKNLGYSSFVTGVIFTVAPIAGILGKPLAGWIADKFKCQKQLFSSSILLTGVTFVAFLYVPKLEKETVCRYEQFEDYLIRGNFDRFNSSICKEMCVYHTSSYTYFIDNNTRNADPIQNISFTSAPKLKSEKDLNCLQAIKIISRNGDITNNDTYLICGNQCDVKFFKEPRSSSDSVYAGYPFWILLILMMLTWLGQATVESVTDTICFELLGDEPNRYGRQRCFGSLGWGIFSVFAGMIFDTGSEEEKNYTAGFYFAAGILLLNFFTSLSLKYEQKICSSHIIRDVVQLLKDIKTAIFSVFCVFMGVCIGFIWNFLFWLVEGISDDREWVTTLEGVLMAIQSLGGDLPLFFVSGWILQKLGHVNSMSLILFTLGIRFILYSVIKDPLYLLPVELLDGITFGLFYATMTSYASIVAPPGTGTTVQGAVGALFNFGIALGSFIGGLLFEKYGGPLTFRIYGFAALIAGVIHVVVQYFCKLISKNESV